MVRVNGSESSEAFIDVAWSPSGQYFRSFVFYFVYLRSALKRAQLVLYADDTTVTASADVKNLATLNSSLI